MHKEDVIVVGAGPYGLSATAHLRAAGASVRTFGRTLSFWQEHMPAGMFLRSSWGASSISDPDGHWSLDAYERSIGTSLARPLPLSDFIAYGQWFQRQAVPDLDNRAVTLVEPTSDGFTAHLDDGDTVTAARVVMATGLRGLHRIPSAVADVGSAKVVHCVDVVDPDQYRGRSVLVVGAGQSAVETAVLLAESSATVELVGRVPEVHWLTRSDKLHHLPPWVTRLLYAPTDVGPPGISWVVATPDLYRRLPRPVQRRMFDRSVRPAASGWLRPRSQGLTFSMGREVTEVTRAGDDTSGDAVRVRLSDGTSRIVDTIVLGTGYEVDIATGSLLAPSLLGRVDTVNGLPVLGTGFESTVPGLHFIGAAAAGTFGPLMRFVSGTTYTGRRLAAQVAS